MRELGRASFLILISCIAGVIPLPAVEYGEIVLGDQSPVLPLPSPYYVSEATVERSYQAKRIFEDRIWLSYPGKEVVAFDTRNQFAVYFYAQAQSPDEVVRDIAYYQDFVYLAYGGYPDPFSFNNGRIEIWQRLSDNTWTQAGKIEHASPRQMARIDHYLWIGGIEGEFSENQVQIFDITTPQSPQLIDEYFSDTYVNTLYAHEPSQTVFAAYPDEIHIYPRPDSFQGYYTVPESVQLIESHSDQSVLAYGSGNGPLGEFKPFLLYLEKKGEQFESFQKHWIVNDQNQFPGHVMDIIPLPDSVLVTLASQQLLQLRVNSEEMTLLSLNPFPEQVGGTNGVDVFFLNPSFTSYSIDSFKADRTPISDFLMH